MKILELWKSTKQKTSDFMENMKLEYRSFVVPVALAGAVLAGFPSSSEAGLNPVYTTGLGFGRWEGNKSEMAIGGEVPSGNSTRGMIGIGVQADYRDNESIWLGPLGSLNIGMLDGLSIGATGTVANNRDHVYGDPVTLEDGSKGLPLKREKERSFGLYGTLGFPLPFLDKWRGDLSAGATYRSGRTEPGFMAGLHYDPFSENFYDGGFGISVERTGDDLGFYFTVSTSPFP